MPVTIQMRSSRVATYSLPAIGVGAPATITHSGKAPQRVVVRNTGGVIVFIAHTTNAIEQAGSTQDAWLLPVGGVDTFVLAPDQQLYAAGAGPNGGVSIAVSDAVPWFLEG